jgi:hypothetical protein
MADIKSQLGPLRYTFSLLLGLEEDMKVFNAARRRMLTLLGVGAAGTALAAVSGSGHVFAKQFVGDASRVKLPDMVYDPKLQMMVDPVTRVPIYEDMQNITVASGLPTITAGCGDCPKKDDDGE